VSLPTGPPFTVIAKLPPDVPIPLNGIDWGEAGSELRILNRPVREPSAVGVNVTPTVQLLPEASAVCGQGRLTVKSPVLEIDMVEMGVDPAFKSVNDALVEAPRRVLAKASDAAPTTNSD
jgi:hypothetical protein